MGDSAQHLEPAAPWELLVTAADYGTEILKMSDFLDVAAMQNIERMKKRETWQVLNEVPKWVGNLASGIKLGVDWNNMGTLVADLSKLGRDIIDGLSDGRYKLRESRSAEIGRASCRERV